MYNASIGSIAGAQFSATPSATPAGQVANHLGVMDDAMSTVARHAHLATPEDAGALLATGDDYVSAGRKALESLDGQLVQRNDRLQQAAAAGAPEGTLAEEREQLQLMTMLRDRIALSVQRVAEIMSGSEGGRSENDAQDVRRARNVQVLNDGYEALRAQLTVVPAPQQVASAYLQR